MKLYMYSHIYKYALEQILLTMFPQERPVYPDGPEAGDAAESALHRGAQYVTATCTLRLGGQVYAGRARVRCADFTDALMEDRLCQRAVKLSFYRAAIRATGRRPVWGALTGIRPAKLLSMDLAAGTPEKEAVRHFCRLYDVSPERAQLCLDTARASLAAEQALEKRDVCLYVGIPFCPTRCAYCSFVSQSVEKSMALIPPFLEALEQEIDALSRAVHEAGLRVISVYMGGGTPTTLSAAQLDALCRRLAERFDLSSLRDYTVEAGRPDTITAEKLRVLRAWGVRRVSVNPQTMDDAVLAAIGRRHTAADVLRALDTVRAVGGFVVNMDLIAGLPGDSPAGFAASLDTVLAQAPENVTVHTLSLKKGSRLTLEGTPIPDAAAVGEMLDYAGAALRRGGYVPYYLYRQKFMSGGFENVGWALPGEENLYNICMMEELCSILSLGGGASTKLVTGTGRIERLFNPKYPKEYIQKLPRLLEDKEKIKEFYHGLSACEN